MRDVISPGRICRRCVVLQRLPATMVGVIAVACIAMAARAQTSEPLSINIAGTITAEPATKVPFAIRVSPIASVPPQSFIRVRGLPPGAALSEGYVIAPGFWAIPLHALPSLQIILPAGTSGKAHFVVTLIGEEGSVLTEVRSTLVTTAATPSNAPPPESSSTMVVPPKATKQPLPANRPDHADSQAATPALRAQDRERALKLLKQGQHQMDEGNVAAARVVFELAADAGLSEAAMALAGTYDGAELIRLNVRGVQPNPAEARRWYERARQLGASDVDQRLRRLGAN